MKDAGEIPAGARFQATLPGPLDCAFVVELPKAELFPLAEEATAQEIAAIVDAIPANDLTIQIDLAYEIELEEYQRRPHDFDMPVYLGVDWTLEEQATVVANVANRVPADVELGFHLCSIWHIDQSKGQDNNVHVDRCNALSRKIDRSIGYIHMPTVPEHDAADFAPLERLELHPETKLYLGVIHMDDGIEGAKRRMAAAATPTPKSGIAAFCGLAQPSREGLEISSRVQAETCPVGWAEEWNNDLGPVGRLISIPIIVQAQLKFLAERSAQVEPNARLLIPAVSARP